MTDKKQTILENVSFVLGILGTAIGCIIPALGTVLGASGILVLMFSQKISKKSTAYVANICAVVVSSVTWIITFLVKLKEFL